MSAEDSYNSCESYSNSDDLVASEVNSGDDRGDSDAQDNSDVDSCQDLFEDDTTVVVNEPNPTVVEPRPSTSSNSRTKPVVTMGDEYQRTKLYNQIKKIHSEASDHDVTPMRLSKARESMIRLEEIFAKFEKVQANLEATAKDAPAFNVQVAAGEPVEEAFSEAREKLRSIIEDLSTGGSGASSSVKVKLPAISLPTFEGQFENWTSFKDLFTAAVENNSSLSAAQKLQYLKSSLRADPLKLIDYLTTTDNNYKEAWRILEERYNNKVEIIRSHTYKLLDLKPVKTEGASPLQLLVDDTIKCVRSLKVLGCSTDSWGELLSAIVEKKLDSATRREWAKRQSGATAIEFEDLITFLNSHIRGLQAAGTSSSNQSNDRRGEKQVKVHHTATEAGKCPTCQGPHKIQDCKEFLGKTPADRSSTAKKNRLCFNCLGTEHMIKNCSSTRTCKKCGKKHHTLLHEDKPDKQMPGKDNVPSVSGNCVAAESAGVVMTVLVDVRGRNGAFQPCRVFVDPGAQADFITEACVARLGLPRKSSKVNVKGFGDTTVGTSRGSVTAELKSRFPPKKSLKVELHVMPRLTGRLPGVKCKGSNWNHLEGLQLADPTWNQPGKIDILLGVRYFHKILLNERRVGPTDEAPVAWDTIFGWIVAGACPEDKATSLSSYSITIDPVDQQLRRFWEIEEPPRKRILTKEERKCEEHFIGTYSRNGDGRFVVSVPFDEERKKLLGKSYSIAEKRLHQVERRLKKNPQHQEMYKEFMREYETLGHMTLVPEQERGEIPGVTNYLCHHYVTNESSSTTKLRVVFDGSAPTTSGLSLNNTMLVGATLQDDLFDLLLRFRSHNFVLKADIAKMFRQFLLRKEDADFHRILWRETPALPLKEYRLNTITYGTACAPNLSTRCIQQLGTDCAGDYPDASRVLLNDTYIDDILTGTETEEEATALFHQLCQAVSTAGLELRKWSSNSKVVMKAIPESLRETREVVFHEGDLIKALGVMWQPSNDSFRFKAIPFDDHRSTTKRSLLSDLARVFDPLGLISCVSLRGKLLLQELWKLPLDWDDIVPQEIHDTWLEYKKDLELLPTLSIPRKVLCSRPRRIELHGFADSSERGFGAIVYLRSVSEDDEVCVQLLTSKTRVAPVRQVTLPRLELCAAVLAAELIVHVREVLKLDADIHLWSDSTITLTWIAASPRRWKTFVANRVATIQELVPVDCWHHVLGVENPADLASRGCSLESLQDCQLWWSGPSWLSEPQLPVFPAPPQQQEDDMEERPTKVTVNSVELEDHYLVRHFSSLIKLKRAVAWILRYVVWKITRKCTTGPLTVVELNNAMNYLIRKSQQQYFGSDIDAVRRSGQVGTKSRLKSLHPYLDSSGILRVSGRLEKADNSNKRHQVILSGRSHLVLLLVDHYHSRFLHGGFQVTWTNLQSEFWILQGRDRVRNFIRSCVRCRRFRAKAAEQLMGQLPEPRVSKSRPFLHCGVDYAGPFVFKDVVGRVPKTYKGYMCLFVCLATKALHLEAVSSLSTEAFIAALRRFVSRRGLCAHIYSDCGTNFVGADRELRSYVADIGSDGAVVNTLSSSGITWHFNPPSSPHRGGLWEAGVKSAKMHIRRVVGSGALTFEQFTTLLSQVEAVLNSRPLYAMSPDAHDLEPLTPGHFLIGEPLLSAPDVDVTLLPANRLSHYQKLQQQLQFFWKRWSREYLNTLQQRNKWMWEKPNVGVGDLVLLVEETPPGNWKMGRILEVHTGHDGLVRSAVVKTATNTTERVVSKLVPLLKNE